MIEPLGEENIFFKGMADEGISYSNERHLEKSFRKEEWIAVSREDLEEKYVPSEVFDLLSETNLSGIDLKETILVEGL